MRAYLNDYELRSPSTLKETLSLLEQGYRPFAGGTDLMVLMDAGVLPPGKFVNILSHFELRGISVQKVSTVIGATTPYTEIRNHAALIKRYPLLERAAKEVGAVAIQNRATLGGNIANASPAADLPPVLLVYGAKVLLRSSTETREVPYSDFHLGYKKLNMERNELIEAIEFREHFDGYHSYFRKVGARQAQAISKTVMAGVALMEDKKLSDIRVAFGSVAPTAIRCHRVEGFLRGLALTKETIFRATEILTEDMVPIDDIRSTAKYRMAVSQNLLEEFLCGIGQKK